MLPHVPQQFSYVNLHTERLRLGCVDNFHYVGLKPQADVHFNEMYEVRNIRRLKCRNKKLRSFVIWLRGGCCDFACVSVSSNVWAKLVVQQMLSKYGNKSSTSCCYLIRHSYLSHVWGATQLFWRWWHRISHCKSISAFSRSCPGWAAILMLILFV